MFYACAMDHIDAPDPSPDAPRPVPSADAQHDAPAAKASLSLRVIALLAVLAACWAAGELLVPIMLAMFLALVANPLVSRLRKLWIPRWLGAMAVVLGALALSVWLAGLLVVPASDWIRQAPTQLQEVAPKFKKLMRQVDKANQAAVSLAKAAGAAPAPAALADADKPHAPNLWSAIAHAPRMLAGVGAVALLTYFFLVYGEGFQRQAIALLPDRQQKHLTSDILRAIETEVSIYVLTISLINLVLGLLLTGALWWLGLSLGDALLWGTAAALLNFAPYIGPLTGVLALALVGAVTFDEPGRMLAPALVFLGLHALESQLITPIVLGRRMSISPLVLLLWLMLWGWLWGIAGLLLAVPMLVCFKIVAERVDGWQGWAKVIE